MNTDTDEHTAKSRRVLLDEHVMNIGLIVLHLAQHKVGDWSDRSVNHVAVDIINECRPAHDLVWALAALSREDARRITNQLKAGPANGEDDKNVRSDESSPTRMTLEEMAEIIDQARYIEHHFEQSERRAWERAQRRRAAEVLELLGRHKPTEVLAKVKELFSTRYGAECVHDVRIGNKTNAGSQTGSLRERDPNEIPF